MRLFADFTIISIPEDRSPPRKTAAHRFEDDDVTALDSPILDGNVKRKRHGCGGRVCVSIHRDHDFLFRQAEFLGRCVEYSGVRLIRNDPIDLVIRLFVELQQRLFVYRNRGNRRR